MARTLGAEHFLPLSEETASLGLRLLQNSEDPDLKSALYSLFAALSLVLKDDSAPFLPPLTQAIFLSLKSTEGVVVSAPSLVQQSEKDSSKTVQVSLIKMSRKEEKLRWTCIFYFIEIFPFRIIFTAQPCVVKSRGNFSPGPVPF